MTKEEIVKYINDELKGYQGYVQFSHRPINREKDIFIDKDPKVEDEQGFIYEAHFYNGKNSVSIKQINNDFYIDKELNVSLDDTQTFISDIQDWNYNIKMAQIWEEKTDELCEDMRVKKLKKVVFAGFEKGDLK